MLIEIVTWSLGLSIGAYVVGLPTLVWMLPMIGPLSVLFIGLLLKGFSKLL